jgi:hypothetical protein
VYKVAAIFSLGFGLILIGILIFATIPIKINDDNRRRLNVARVLTAILPGLGHIYMGSIIRGIILLIFWALLGILNIISNLFRFTTNQISGSGFLLDISVAFVIWICGFIGLSGWRKDNTVQNNQSL